MLKFFSRPIFLGVLSGLLLALSWYEALPSLTVFFGFVPFFIALDKLFENNSGFWKVMLVSYVTFFTWSALSVWWIYKATIFGAVAAFLITAFMMTLVMAGYYFIRKHAGRTIGMFGFVTLWIVYEQFFHNSEIAWPWLTLGNGIGNHAWLIQWYEFTGVLGGSLWILAINFFVLGFFTSWREKNYGRIYWYSVDLAVLILVPSIISVVIFFKYDEKPNPVNVVVVQPNIDPYNEKFNGLTNQQQFDIMLNLAKQNVDSTTDYVVCPESSIDDRLWHHKLSSNSTVLQIKRFVSSYPNVKWITGMLSIKLFFPTDTIPPTARKHPGRDHYFINTYNTATQIDTSEFIPLYHKSKLVVGVEMMPYPKYMKYLEKFSIDLGGFVGSFGTQPNRGVFRSSDSRFGVGPIICYESVFGEYVADYVKNGANLLFVITNDGWWGDTPGYVQHLTFSRIRAIEMRRSIARSANTGISAIINQRGDVVESLGWWKRGVISGTINANNKITYYAKNGDYIGRLSAFLALLTFAVAFSRFFRRDKSKAK